MDEDHEYLSEAHLYSAANSNQYVDAEMLLGVCTYLDPLRDNATTQNYVLQHSDSNHQQSA